MRAFDENHISLVMPMMCESSSNFHLPHTKAEHTQRWRAGVNGKEKININSSTYEAFACFSRLSLIRTLNSIVNASPFSSLSATFPHQPISSAASVIRTHTLN